MVTCCICGKELTDKESRYIYFDYEDKETPLYAHFDCHEKRIKDGN